MEPAVNIVHREPSRKGLTSLRLRVERVFANRARPSIAANMDGRNGARFRWKTRRISELGLQLLICPDFGSRRPEVEPNLSARRALGNDSCNGFWIWMAEDGSVGADQNVPCLHRVQQLRRGVAPAAVVAEFEEVELPWKMLSSADGKRREGML